VTDDPSPHSEAGGDRQEESLAAADRREHRLGEAVPAANGRGRRSSWLRGRLMLALGAAMTAMVVAVPAVLCAVHAPGQSGGRGPAVESAHTITLDTPPRPDQFLFAEIQITAHWSCMPPSADPEHPLAVRLGTCTAAPPVTLRDWLSVDGTKNGRMDQTMPGGKHASMPLPGCSLDEQQSADKHKQCFPADVDQSRLPANVKRMARYLDQQLYVKRDEAEDAYAGQLAPAAFNDPTDVSNMFYFLDQRIPREIRQMDDSRDVPHAGLEFAYAGRLGIVSYVPLTVRPVLFQAITKISGVTVRPGVTDVAGRPAIAVGLTASRTEYTHNDYFFDPATRQCLGERITATRAHDGIPVGTAVRAIAVTWMGYVDQVGRLPS
jgi:hypothetical protein